MKKIIVMMLAITIMTTTLIGCGGKNAGSDTNTDINHSSEQAIDKSQSALENESEFSIADSEATINGTEQLDGFEEWKDSGAIRALKRVLSLKETVIEMDAPSATENGPRGGKLYLSELNICLDYNFDTPIILDQYAVVDLDQDNTPEVVVRLLNEGESRYSVLRYNQGQVYSYSYVLGELDTLKIDGTYRTFSEEMDPSIMRLSFAGKRVKENCLGRATSSNGEMSYFVEGKEVTSEGYNTFCEKYYRTPDVT